MKARQGTSELAARTATAGLSTRQRYWLFQLPGLAVALGLSALGTRWFDLPLWSAAIVVAVWAAKDAVLYRFLKASYEGPKPTGLESMVGTVGTALEELAPRGLVRVEAELWRAESAAPIAAGQPVRVTGCVGMTLQVSPVSPDEEDPARQSA